MAGQLDSEMAQLRDHLASLVNKVLTEDDGALSGLMIDKLALNLRGRLQVDLQPADREDIRRLYALLADLRAQGVPVQTVARQDAGPNLAHVNADGGAGRIVERPAVIDAEPPSAPFGRGGERSRAKPYGSRRGESEARPGGVEDDGARLFGPGAPSGLAMFAAGFAAAAVLFAVGLGGKMLLDRQKAGDLQAGQPEASQSRQGGAAAQSPWTTALARIDALDGQPQREALDALCGQGALQASDCAPPNLMALSGHPAETRAAVKTLRNLLKDDYPCLGGGATAGEADANAGDPNALALAACFIEPAS